MVASLFFGIVGCGDNRNEKKSNNNDGQKTEKTKTLPEKLEDFGYEINYMLLGETEFVYVKKKTDTNEKAYSFAFYDDEILIGYYNEEYFYIHKDVTEYKISNTAHKNYSNMLKDLDTTAKNFEKFVLQYYKDNRDEEAVAKSKEISYDKTFVFDDLEITFHNNVSFTSVTNRYSDLNGREVAVVPISITNKSAETHGLNRFYYTIFGSQGTKLDSVSAYFDDSVDSVGKMRPEATSESNMYILYDGNGDYYVEFNNYSDKIEVKLPINK